MGNDLHKSSKESLQRYEEKLKEEGVKNIATLDLDVESIIKSKQNETLTDKFKKVGQVQIQ